MEETARAIVEAILRNLKDRQGIDHALGGIDDDIYQEMVEDLIADTVTILDERQMMHGDIT